MIVVVVIDLLQDIPPRVLDSYVHLRAGQRGLIESNVTDARQAGAEVLHGFLSVVQDDQFCAIIALTLETAHRLFEKSRAIARWHDAGYKLINRFLRLFSHQVRISVLAVLARIG